MIKDNVITFGYGDIFVGYNIYGLTLTYGKPPAKIGSLVINDEIEEIIEDITIPINYNTESEFKKLINSVSKNNTSFEFNGYIFDFSNYNPKSVEVVKKYLEKLTTSLLWMMPLAC